MGDPVNGDKIYNGALDNASGVAALLEIARGLHAGAAAAEAFDPLPDGHRRGAGAARLAVLLGDAGLSAREDARRTSTWTASTNGAGRRTSRSSAWAPRISTTTLRDAAGEQGRTLQAGPGAGEGLLLPLGPLQFRQAGRAGAATRTPASTSSASRRNTASRSGTSTPNRDYHAPSDEVKPDWDLTGAREDCAAAARRRLPGGAGRQVSRVEAGQRVQGEARRDAEEIDMNHEDTKARHEEDTSVFVIFVAFVPSWIP